MEVTFLAPSRSRASERLLDQPQLAQLAGASTRAGSTARGRSAALMYGTGGILAGGALVAQPAAASNRPALLVLCGIAAACAALIWALGSRFTLRLAHLATGAGSVIVGAGVALGKGTFLSFLYGMLFVWIAQVTALFFRPKAAGAHVGFASVVHAAALSTLAPGPRAATWFLTTGTCYVVLVVHRLMDRHSARLKGIVEHSGAAAVVLGRDGTIRDVGGTTGQMFGHDATGLVGTSVLDLVHDDDRPAVARALAQTLEPALGASLGASFEARLRRASGEWVPVDANLENALDDPSLGGLVLTLRDVTERKRLEDELDRQAHHDPVTGLPNRRLFVHRVRQALLERGTDTCAVLFVDLDHFKDVNDTLGHAAGDDLLEALVPRLVTVLRADD
ncbi:MAG TPA: diguanylate cyclase, partial [Actinomycetota bacterium]